MMWLNETGSAGLRGGWTRSEDKSGTGEGNARKPGKTGVKGYVVMEGGRKERQLKNNLITIL